MMSKILNGSAISLIGFATLGLTMPDDARAQPAPACELHIFPGVGVGVNDATQIKVEQGVVGNQIRDGVLNMFRIKDPKAVQAFLEEALPPADHLAMIRSIDYAKTLVGKGKTVIIHDQPTQNVTIFNFKTQPRSAVASAACYHEIVISGTYFEKSTLTKKLKTSYFTRDFGSGAVPLRSKFKAASAAISNFPPKTAADAKTAREAVRKIAQEHLVAIANGE